MPKLAYKTFLHNYTNNIKIKTLTNFPIKHNLIINITHFIKNLKTIKPYIINNSHTTNQNTNIQTPTQITKYHQFSNYINYNLYYTTYPQFNLNPKFINPTTITLTHHYNKNNHNHNKKKHITQLNNQNNI